MKIVVAICIGFVFETVVLAQRHVDFEFGIRTGVPITKPLSRVSTGFRDGIPCCGILTESFPTTLIVGPTAGIVIRDRVQVEVEALYRPLRLSMDSASLDSPSSSVTRTRGSLWDFPLVANYRFFSGAVRPYGGGGLVLATWESGTQENRYITTAGTELRNSFDIGGRDWFPAYIINAGVEWNSRHLAIRPEVRYSGLDGRPFRWNRHPNQLEFFIGFSIRALYE